ncbi:hypothetical protein POM88_004671 [Heracleum sosnowskyi]|uniref:Uncharacterized protein n=1 Tax=Heracleum sosnowskyi TaxID=360622 RepID=A0AAD8JJZ8_9APIA|nr:hypothetical protein POM88_004671 [Heracleum sosnowskyi]
MTEALVKQMSLDSTIRVVMLCWSIWTARNDMVWNQRRRSVDEVVSLATITLNQYIAAQNVGSIPSLNPLRSGDGAEQWTKPGLNTIKINVDASIFEKKTSFGDAIVIQDDNGF